jgi:hypothetical protein
VCRGQLTYALDHLGERDGERVVDVGRHLRSPAAEIDPQRPHPGQAAARLAQPVGDLAGPLQPRPLELDVEGRERRPGGDQGGAGGWVQLRWAEIGPHLAGVNAPAQLGQAPGAKEGALATGRI